MKNAKTEREYSGNNEMILEIVQSNGGYKSDEWATFIQWGELGRKVTKGQHGTPIVRMMKVDTKNKKTKKIETKELPRHYTVFNREQTEEATK